MPASLATAARRTSWSGPVACGGAGRGRQVVTNSQEEDFDDAFLFSFKSAGGAYRACVANDMCDTPIPFLQQFVPNRSKAHWQSWSLNQRLCPAAMPAFHAPAPHACASF